MKSLVLKVLVGLAGIIVAGLVGLGLSAWSVGTLEMSPTTTFVFGGGLLFYYVLAPLAMSTIAVPLLGVIASNRKNRSFSLALAIGIAATLLAYAVQAFAASTFDVDLYPERWPATAHNGIRLVVLVGSAALLTARPGTKD